MTDLPQPSGRPPRSPSAPPADPPLRTVLGPASAGEPPFPSKPGPTPAGDAVTVPLHGLPPAGAAAQSSAAFRLVARLAGWALKVNDWRGGKCRCDERDAELYAAARLRAARLTPAETLEAQLRMYEKAVDLVMHEDKNNWGKWYNMTHLNLGLLGAYTFLVTQASETLAFDVSTAVALLSLFAAQINIWFTVTLWAGISCLNGHKSFARDLDLCLAGLAEPPVATPLPSATFVGKQGPTRVLLQWGGPLLVLLWISLTALSWA